MSKMQLRNRTAVVTGAASGMGRAISLSLARRGCHLALADLNEAGLAETAELAAPHNVRVTRHRLDVGDADAVAAFPEGVQGAHDGVDLLFNNAGVAVEGTFEQVSEVDYEWLFNINFHGVVRMTRAFLPLLRARDEARVVNISSVFGLIAPPGQTAYGASKFAVRGFSEALRHELVGSTVGVTVVHPGGVATNITHNARYSAGLSPEEIAQMQVNARRLLTLPPARAGETIVKGVEQRKDRVLVGRDAQLIAWIVRLTPVSYWKLFGRFAA